MKNIRTLIVTICMTGLASLALAQTAPSAPSAAPKRLTAADAKNHVGEMATVCGKVVNTKIPKYGLAGHGKPITFDLDKPEPNPVFYFIVFGEKKPTEVAATYSDKSVCVTGKIDTTAGVPFILTTERSQIKTQTENK